MSNNMEKPGLAVMYLRVSSAKQEDGYSLDAQEKLALEYAQKHCLKVVKVWKVQESAWGKKERKNFTEMLDYLKRNESVQHIIFDVVDRMTRNDNDKIRIIRLIKEQHKTVHFSRSNQMLNSENLDSTKEFMMDVEVAASKKLSNDIAYKTRMGMTEKAEQGLYPSNAPLGYRNTLDSNKEAIIEIDPIMGPLIKELFEVASTGKYSLEELMKIFYDKGLRSKAKKNKVPITSLSIILHNSFYYGVFQWGGKLYQGKYPPLINKTLWDKVQEALLAKAHRFDTKHSYAFNRLIECEHCGHSILGAAAKHKYLYYRCAHYNKEHKKSGYLKEPELAQKLSNVIKDIELPKDVIQVLIKGLKKKGQKANRISSNTKILLEQELSKVNSRMGTLLDMRLDGKISDEIFQTKNNELMDKKNNIEAKLNTCQGSADGAARAIQGLEILSNLEKCYQEADNYGKADLLRAVGKKYVLTTDNQVVVEYKEPFKAIYEAKAFQEKSENAKNWKQKTARLNQGCLNLSDDKMNIYSSKSCSKNYWGG